MTLRSFLTMTPPASMRSLPPISLPPSSCRFAFVSMSSKWWWPLPIPYSFVVPFSWKQSLRIPIFTSHLAIVIDVSAHPSSPSLSRFAPTQNSSPRARIISPPPLTRS
ncbi:hypothetical protein GW17_00043848 [Ensete ventricosum]|nr:hypothetical protein GW17_00043848 [Ensete ventricosum]